MCFYLSGAAVVEVEMLTLKLWTRICSKDNAKKVVLVILTFFRYANTKMKKDLCLIKQKVNWTMKRSKKLWTWIGPTQSFHHLCHACLLQFLSRFFDLASIQLTFRVSKTEIFHHFCHDCLCGNSCLSFNLVNVQSTFGYADANLLSSLLCMYCYTAGSKFQSECV